MRIALIGLKGLPTTWTGIEFHVDRVGRGLAARGHQVTAYARSSYTQPGLAEHQGIRLITLPTIRTKHLDASLHSLLASVHAAFCRYDVVHYHGIGPGFFSVLPRLLGRRIVCTVHRLDWQAEKWRWPARQLLRLAELVSVRVAHRTIVVSAGLRDHVRERHGRSAVLIPNGLDPAAFRPVDRVRQAYGLEGRDYVLFMGRLSPEKRVDWLIRSFLELPRPHSGGKPLRLVIAGGFNATENHVAELRRLAGDDPRIVFTGFVSGPEKEELLSNALVFVLPSRIEGLPIVLLEAMGYGLCAVASDISPHREIVTDGVDGVLFDTSHRDDLTARLQALLDRPQRISALGRSARKKIAERPGWDEVVARTEAVYRDLVTGEQAQSR
jgi:glycosyltransferase involved in cell wall biosynthesis